MNRADKDPIPEEDRIRVLASVADTNAVLVGGQATSLWAEHYKERIPELNDSGPYVSSDVDFVGDKSLAETCAKALGGKLKKNSFDIVPINTALVSFDDQNGQERVVDFLANVHGLDYSWELAERAVRFEYGGKSFLLIDPLSHMRTRLANLVSLRPGSQASIHQAQISVWVAREWVRDLHDQHDVRTVLKLISKWFPYIEHNKHARKAARVYEVEAFEMLSCLALSPKMPKNFRTIRYPQMSDAVARSRKKG